MKRTVSIPMSDPRHPMHEHKLIDEMDALYGKYQEPRPARTQYEDQYGRLRWSDTNQPVNP